MTNTICGKYQRNIAASITVDFVEEGEEDGQLDDNHTQEDRPHQFGELFAKEKFCQDFDLSFSFHTWLISTKIKGFSVSHICL